MNGEQPRPGRLIAVEGIDQSGKQTQVEGLVRWLAAAGVPARAFGFPAYSTPVGRLLRAYLDGSADLGLELRHLLFAANRWELAPELAAELANGTTCVVDRYSASGLAYGLAQGLDLVWLEGLERGLPPADLTVLLDLDPDAAFARKRRERDRYEGQRELLLRCRAAYRSLAAERGWLVIDAALPVETIAETLQIAACTWCRTGTTL